MSEGELARPLRTLEVSGLADAVVKIGRVIVEEGIEKVVVGRPESGEARNIAIGFVKKLGSRVEGVQVLWVEETLSTSQAQKNLLGLGITVKTRVKKEDSEAAAIILQSYLDSRLRGNDD